MKKSRPNHRRHERKKPTAHELRMRQLRKIADRAARLPEPRPERRVPHFEPGGSFAQKYDAFVRYKQAGILAQGYDADDAAAWARLAANYRLEVERSGGDPWALMTIMYERDTEGRPTIAVRAGEDYDFPGHDAAAMVVGGRRIGIVCYDENGKAEAFAHRIELTGDAQ